MGFTPGGGGGIGSASDVALNSPANTELLSYDASIAKWKNVPQSAQSSTPGIVMLDSFAGGTDDDKLDAAFAFVKAQSQIPAIMFSGRAYEFTQPHNTFDGMKLIGPSVSGWQNVERSGGKLPAVKIKLSVGSGASSFLVGTVTNYNVYVADLAFYSTNEISQFLHHPIAAGTMFAAAFHNLTFNGLKYVMGAPTDPASITLNVFSGQWTCTNPTDTQFSLRGSDCTLWLGGKLNIGGSGTAGTGVYAGGGRYLIYFASLGKTTVGDVYVTADDGWRAIRVTGTNSFGPGLRCCGLTLEGRNAGDPSFGALVKVESGHIFLRDVWLAYAMSNPAAYTDQTDKGVVHVSGGICRLSGVTYDKSTAASYDVPIVFVTGSGTASIADVDLSAKGGAWSVLPKVQQSSAGMIRGDDTVQIVTGAIATVLRNTAESGADGAAVTDINSAGSGLTAFTSVVNSGTSVLAYSTAQAMHGSKSFIFQLDPNAAGYVTWGNVSEATNDAAVRVYARFSAIPTAGACAIINLRSGGGGTSLASLSLNSTGKLQVLSDVSSVSAILSVDSVSINTWYRIELLLNNSSASTGSVSLATFAGDGLSQIANLSGVATAQNFGTSAIGTVRFGRSNASGSIGAFYLDDVAFGAGSTTNIGASS